MYNEENTGQQERAFRPERRSAGALKQRRVQIYWPENRTFRILSIDGGGIRGIFPSSFLAGLEERFLNGSSISEYFDLITGTSTGGIIALGLAAGLRAAEIRDLYLERGCEIFPPMPSGLIGNLRRKCREWRRYVRVSYDQKALMRIMHETFGSRKFGDARTRLCIPSCEGHHGEVYIFKTPHHSDFRNDAHESMTKVALSTSVAPTYFRPFEDGGYIFVDGGIWANNPIMVGLVDALSCYSVTRERVQILSLGCGETPYIVRGSKIRIGGILHWHDIIFAAMKFESLNAMGQAQLLIGADGVTRIDARPGGIPIPLDDWTRAVAELPKAAASSLDEHGENVASIFLSEKISPYRPAFDFRIQERKTT